MLIIDKESMSTKLTHIENPTFPKNRQSNPTQHLEAYKKMGGGQNTIFPRRTALERSAAKLREV